MEDLDINKLPLSKKGKEYLKKIKGHPELREFCPTCKRDDAGYCSNPWHHEHAIRYIYPKPSEIDLFESMFLRAQHHGDDFETWMFENRLMGITIKYKPQNNNMWPTEEGK